MADLPSRLRDPSEWSTAEMPDAPAAAERSESVVRLERLREFQTRLTERLRRAQTAPLTVNRLGFQIGEHRLLLDIADAGEIITVPAVTPVPLTKPWYRGLANVRGNLLGIVDLSLFAGGPATPLDNEGRVLTVAADLGFPVGLLVSRMLGLRSAAELSIPADGSEEAPAASPAEEGADPFAPWVRSRLVDAQGVRWQVLDLSALTSDDRFCDIARS